ncbi:PIG-X [Cerioporus squamosus]|nr:PIG-X [Cerioporus squamosus]
MSLASLSSSVSTQGFHFTVSTTVNVASSQESRRCSLHVLHDLDPHVYADQYELAQRLGYTSTLWGTFDLERPVSAVDQAGSVLLLTTDLSQLVPGRAANITLEVPLHARYGRPVTGVEDAYRKVGLRRPVGFFACSQEDVAPVPETLRQYTSLPGWPSLSLSLIPDTSPGERHDIVIPVGKLDDLTWVDVGTAAVMVAMFFYLLAASIRTARRLLSKPSMKTD